MNILLTVPEGAIKTRHFPPECMARLRALGTVVENPLGRPFTRAELKERLADCEVLLTHWHTVPQLDNDLLDAAPRLRVVAHCAGTVAHIASAGCYARGIAVLSANAIMAEYVAEGVLGMMIASLRRFSDFNDAMHRGVWAPQPERNRSLLDLRVGLVGLGTVGRRLLDLLRPLGCAVTVYDPYLPADALAEWPAAHAGTLADVLRCPVVSIHAAQTPETFHLIDAAALAQLPDGALLINTARGSLVETNALIAALQTGRISAALDVYEHEGCAQPAALRDCPNVLLLPHQAAAPAGAHMTNGILDDLARYARGEALRLRVTHNQFLHMTQE